MLYEYLYTYLFNRVTDVIEKLKKMEPSKQSEEAILWLKAAQMKCEDIFIMGDDFFKDSPNE